MKKERMAFFTIVLVGLVVACHASNEDFADDVTTNHDRADVYESAATFIGTIEAINGEMALVAIEEGDILHSGSKVDVKLSVADDTTFQIGDRVRVGYEGPIREIHPLGIHTMFCRINRIVGWFHSSSHALTVSRIDKILTWRAKKWISNG